jgi:hypothetical protein
LTAKRRSGLLVERGIAAVQDRKFTLTAAGRAALPDAPFQPEPWVDLERIRASLSRDVVERVTHRPFDDRSATMRSEQSTAARTRVGASHRGPRQKASDEFNSLDRMAG